MRILFQGDSITDGERLKGRDNEWDLNHQMGAGYPYLIAAKLGAEYPEAGYEFFNRGVSSDRVTDLYGRWRQDTLALCPDLISILVGVNDCGRAAEKGKAVDERRFEMVYARLLEEAGDMNPDVKLVLCEPFCLTLPGKEEYGRKLRACMVPVQEAVRRLALRYHGVFVPLQERFDMLAKGTAGAAHWIWDCVHPTECGHQVIADEWLKQNQILILERPYLI